MVRWRTTTLTIALVGLALALAAPPASARLITEFPAPSAAHAPAGIAAGPDGAMWFFGIDPHSDAVVINKLWRITQTGAITEFPLPPGIDPDAIATGPDGAMWFAGDGLRGVIGRITTAGAVKELDLPLGSHPAGIAAGPDGAMWFGDPGLTGIGRITTAGAVTEFGLPSGSAADDIIAGPDRAMWFSGLNDDATSAFGRITLAGSVRRFRVPVFGGAPSSIAAGPDGAVWFFEDTGFGPPRPAKVGRITPAGTITTYPLPEYRVPVCTSVITAITAGPDGAMWFATLDGIGRLTTGGDFTEFPVREKGNKIKFAIAAGPDGAIWFIEQAGDILRGGGGSIGRLDLPALGHKIQLAKLAHSNYRARAGARLSLRYEIARRARATVGVRVGCLGGYVGSASARAHAGHNTIRLRAPRKPGRYVLALSAVGNGQVAADDATLVVRR